MRDLALFAGAGGGVLAGHLLGWRTVCAVEIDPFCRRVLLARQRDGMLPEFPVWDNVVTFDGRRWRGHVDVVSGGYPCQPFSGASRGRRVAIDRWPDMLRIVREVEPPYVFAENVGRKTIECAARDLEALGYAVRCARVSAASVAAAQRRERYWLAASPHGDGKRGLRIDAEVAGAPALACDLWRSRPGSDVVGVDDGLADRMVRLAALGNGQVPAVARLAWTGLTDG